MKKKKRQFRGTSKKRTFFDRKVRVVGFSRVVSLSKVIPEDWAYVRVTPINRTPDAIEVLFEKLLSRDDDAQTKTASKTGE